MDPTALQQLVDTLAPEDLAALMPMGGFEKLLGLRYTFVSPARVEAVLQATPELVQPYGLVHGGVYCALAESVCSVGAALVVLPTGQSAVGVSNRTEFKRAVRAGHAIDVVAEPLRIEGRDHTWRATMTVGGEVCAVGEVVVRALPQGTRLAGEAVALSGASGAGTP
jgi:1,4-dihydroxy-2-naphthoyl-CoA hydrolase